MIRIELRKGWDYIQVPEKAFCRRGEQTEETGQETAPGEDEETARKTCAKLPPYEGKSSAPTIKGQKEPDKWMSGKRLAEDARAGTRRVDGGERDKYRAAGAAAGKGVFRIAPGPRGSGIQEVKETNMGEATPTGTEKDAMTTEEFEQQILKKPKPAQSCKGMKR